MAPLSNDVWLTRECEVTLNRKPHDKLKCVKSNIRQHCDNIWDIKFTFHYRILLSFYPVLNSFKICMLFVRDIPRNFRWGVLPLETPRQALTENLLGIFRKLPSFQAKMANDCTLFESKTFKIQNLLHICDQSTNESITRVMSQEMSHCAQIRSKKGYKNLSSRGMLLTRWRKTDGQTIVKTQHDCAARHPTDWPPRQATD